MFKHILVPVDGSSNSANAVEKAIGQAKAFGAKLTLVTVIDNYPFAGVGGDFAYGQAEYLAAATANANSALEKAQAAISAQGMTCDKRVIEEHVIHEGILDTAKTLGVDLIVLETFRDFGELELALDAVREAGAGRNVALPMSVIPAS